MRQHDLHLPQRTVWKDFSPDDHLVGISCILSHDFLQDRGSSAPAISDADLEMLRTVFRQFDVDGTARMASRDLEAALEKLG